MNMDTPPPLFYLLVCGWLYSDSHISVNDSTEKLMFRPLRNVAVWHILGRIQILRLNNEKLVGPIYEGIIIKFNFSEIPTIYWIII